MSTSGYRDDDGDNKEDRGSMKWPLEYWNETKEFMCGWCGQALTTNPSHHDIETHFQTCQNSNETALLVGYKYLLKVNQKLEGLNADIQKRMDKMKAELMEEIKTELDNIKIDVGTESNFQMTQLDKKFLDLKSNIKQDLETEIDVLKASLEKSDAAVSTLLTKVNTLEEKMHRETSVDPAMKTAEVNETISTAADNSILLEAKTNEVASAPDAVLSNELESKKKKTKRNKKQLEEDESAKSETANALVTKENISHQEQLTIPMNCFNLITHSGLFQPSFRWTIDDIEAKLSRGMSELSSEMFEWNGYPVQVRAKLQLKKDDCVYLSLHLEKASKDERKMKDFAPIPQVYYLLKDLLDGRNPRHKCLMMGYLAGTKFKYSLGFERCVGRASCFNGPPYNVKDQIEIEIYVESLPMTRQMHSHDGTLEWAIDNYQKRVQLEEDGLVSHHESPYFYTSPRGYRVRVEIFLRRDETGGGGGPAARIVFVSGEFDAELPESFFHRTTVSLINRKNPLRSVGVTIVENIMNASGFALEICKMKEMENLIENDTLFCKVVVKGH